MIEKMQFLSISGPIKDIDRVIETYLSKYEIHLEYAMSELGEARGLTPFSQDDPYREPLKKSELLIKTYGDLICGGSGTMKPEEAAACIREAEAAVAGFQKEREELLKKREAFHSSEESVLPFETLNYDLSEILKFKALKFRFGRMPKEYYDKFMDYVYETMDVIMLTCRQDQDAVWVVYFVPERAEDRIDAIFTSMHFERFLVPDQYIGTPDEVISELEGYLKVVDQKIHTLDEKINSEIKRRGEVLAVAHRSLLHWEENFGIKKYAACTKHDEHTFYILCGWMVKSDAEKLRAEIDQDQMVYCLVENDHSKLVTGPPTKIKNPGIFKPFEMYTKMYGLPSYNEIDPTILIGISYSILFGFMFGDVGQGLCLALGGFLLYKLKGSNLAAIIGCCGIFSTIFGFMFGSIFGFEDVIEPLWLRPGEAMTTLPFIGNMNTVFVVAIALGMGMILLVMLLNIVNGIRNHEPEKAWFDTNGIAGFVFYAAVVTVIVLFMTGHTLPATGVLIVMFVIPLLIIFMKEPLAAAVEKRKEKLGAMFFVQGIFEMIEVLLSYFSNTLSFVRVGAFAVSHAAMMSVVMMLAGAESGTPSIPVIVFGNIFVCGMEGLVVGIQVLRLEYYEMFSRFYSGGGREFKPYKQDKISQ